MTGVPPHRAGAGLIAGLLAVALAGCSIQVQVGRRPEVSVLETTLKAGQSTQADVLRELGPPVDRSMSAMPIEAPQRMMWTYYYRHSSLKDARQFFLFVYFVDDRYDGYLWFSSFPN
jgi:hypothetical protein